MVGYILNRQYERLEVIDVFYSFIWTDRYYGDSDFELVVPATKSAIASLTPGVFIELEGSQEIMMLETCQISKDGKLKVSGISLLSWLNNRIIRKTSAHEDRYWNIEGYNPGNVLWKIVYEMCCVYGPEGTPNQLQYLIPGLMVYNQVYHDPIISVAVPYGPLYDAIREIAVSYEIGMTIILERPSTLSFIAYRGTDRSSGQEWNPVVRFSPDMESLTDIEEITSITNYKTHSVVFVPSNPDGLAQFAGSSKVSSFATGFDIRLIMVFAEDITTDLVQSDPSIMMRVLNQRAAQVLGEHAYVAHVDGEIVPSSQFQYGRDYSLGDIVEIAGHSGIVQNAMITEYIRSHDDSGETAYPSVTMIVQRGNRVLCIFVADHHGVSHGRHIRRKSVAVPKLQRCDYRERTAGGNDVPDRTRGGS